MARRKDGMLVTQPSKVALLPRFTFGYRKTKGTRVPWLSSPDNDGGDDDDAYLQYLIPHNGKWHYWNSSNGTSTASSVKLPPLTVRSAWRTVC